MDGLGRKRAHYGKKSNLLSTASAAIFGKEATPPPSSPLVREAPEYQQLSKANRVKRAPSSRQVLEDVTDLLKNVTLEEAAPILTPVTSDTEVIKKHRRKSPRKPIASDIEDVAQLLDLVTLEEPSSILGHDVSPKRSESPAQRRSPRRHAPSPERRDTSSRGRASKRSDPRLKWLRPLIEAYQLSGNPNKKPISIQTWNTLLDDEWKLEKIAESSFAEVFKVINECGTSILKFMALRPPTGPGSQRETAIPVEMVISEVLIMNTMADLDGYVEFKEAHIIEGRPPKALIEAFDAFASEKETFFPKPSSYQKGQLFLALELGDAGTDVEHFEIKTTAQLWDIFLGVVAALATGEQAFGFEHRDLHEGNVCLRQVCKSQPLPKQSPSRLGFSGLEVTLLDYTLSEMESGQVMYLDLEADFELFAESEILQRQMYRRMRNWVFFRTHGTKHALFDNEEAPQHGSWEMFEPYTNVIWLFYILDYTIKHFKGHSKEKRVFMKETEELRALLQPDRRAYDGGFGDALGVYDYCVEQGWIPEEAEE